MDPPLSYHTINHWPTIGVLEKYGALCIGSVGEPPKAGTEETSAVSVEDDEFQFGEMIPYGDPSWYITYSCSFACSLLQVINERPWEHQLMPFTCIHYLD